MYMKPLPMITMHRMLGQYAMETHAMGHLFKRCLASTFEEIYYFPKKCSS